MVQLLSMKTNHGSLILFGSGETADSGKRILRLFLRRLPEKQKVAILETPAGFQPNCQEVAEEVAQVFNKSLKEFVEDVTIIAARHKNDPIYSPNNLDILKPLKDATFIFLGPGSPTYAVRHLKNSKAWEMIISRWKNGANLCFSSAGALAASDFTLPVYEIFKVGEDLHWKKGLNLLKVLKKSIVFVTHWNNKEGGKELDTRFCYMGLKRFANLKVLLPKKPIITGIDEHTALIFDFCHNISWIEGVGGVTLMKGSQKTNFTEGEYKLSLFL